MRWIHNYQLFLFDFDGILANTEDLHFRAYKKMCADRGFSLKWDLKTYAWQASLYGAGGLKEAIYKQFPDLKRYEPCWEILYREKKRAYTELLMEEQAPLMPGIEPLIQALSRADIKRCVVTNSPEEHVKMIRAKQPLLNTIPVWITREHYSQPKPASECYEKAIAMLGKEGDRIIGFEDSPRGLKALLGTKAEGVFVTSLLEKKQLQQLSQEVEKDFHHFNSFDELLEKGISL